ncbi:MAG: phosphoribosylaminoimidazolesuccinocarboxamide synthase [candidate division WS1 bacterium]|jgi:phosphoribosylaminoimidazole-succinocarboxamide synthase|nr:phosphoribosylaminoimidazolesuccinocarboxamide synthase [candidate division WS1 bacterium]
MDDSPEKAILYTDLPGALSRRFGKVRDIYDYGDCLLIVATDRISAFDCVMPNGIPGKGKILTALSKFWFDKTQHIIPNHIISMDPADFPEPAQESADLLEGRTMMVQKAEVVPVECVVRGYLAGSGWKSYQETGEVCGHKLPPGLQLSDRLPEPLFTPSTKAESGHDENISYAQAAEIVGQEIADQLQEKSLALYNFANGYLTTRRLMIADTKYEFGLLDGKLIVIDEMMTPDSSRYWDTDKYQSGRAQEAMDKQYVRDYLETLDWNKEPPAPELPPEVVAETRRIYEEALRRVTG